MKEVRWKKQADIQLEFIKKYLLNSKKYDSILLVFLKSASRSISKWNIQRENMAGVNIQYEVYELVYLADLLSAEMR